MPTLLGESSHSQNGGESDAPQQEACNAVRANPERGSESGYVFTLVHGTFAPDAPWTHDSSLLCRTLKRELRGRVVFRRFNWSARNSHLHRLGAARNLREELNQILNAEPTAHHFVIAHSHGGNVVFYAFKDSHLYRKVQGIICLATPFLHRHVNWMGLLDLILPVVLLVMAWASRRSLTYRHPPLVENLLTAGLACLALVATVTVGACILGRRRGIGTYLGFTPAPAVMDELQLPKLGGGKVLVVRTTGDEVSALLIGTQLIGWALRRVAEAIRHATELLLPAPAPRSMRTSRRFTVGRFLASAGFLVLVALLIWTAGEGWQDLLLSSLAVLFLVPAITLLVLCLASLLIHIPFGPDAMLWSIRVPVTVEAAPPGQVDFIQETRYSDFEGRLVHSELYDHEFVVTQIAEWVARRAREA